MSHTRPVVRVIGVGSPFGADQRGWQAVELLQEQGLGRCIPDWELELDYSYVDTRAEQALYTRPGGSISASDLPDVDTTLHHLVASGTWHLDTNLSLKLDYQYYSYESDDWAWENVRADTVGKVLTFGQKNPDEDLHYVGASVIYRWQ